MKQLTLLLLVFISLSSSAQQWRERMVARRTSSPRSSNIDSQYYSYSGNRGLLLAPSNVGVDYDTNKVMNNNGSQYYNRQTYDNNNRLISLANIRSNSVNQEHYTLDAAGNRIAVTREYLDSNQNYTQNRETYTLDSAGHQIVVRYERLDSNQNWVWTRKDFHNYDRLGRITSNTYTNYNNSSAIHYVDSFRYSRKMHGAQSDSVWRIYYYQRDTAGTINIFKFWANGNPRLKEEYGFQEKIYSDLSNTTTYDSFGHIIYFQDIISNSNFDYDSLHRLKYFYYEYWNIGVSQIKGDKDSYGYYYKYDSLGNYDNIIRYHSSVVVTSASSDTFLLRFWYEPIWDTTGYAASHPYTIANVPNPEDTIPTLRYSPYPNPSDGHFAIGYQATQLGAVQLTLQTLGGDLVSTTYTHAAIGYNTLTYDAPLSSGVYVYSLRVDGRVKRGKILVE